jgi:pilus assembly protein CpaC
MIYLRKTIACTHRHHTLSYAGLIIGLALLALPFKLFAAEGAFKATVGKTSFLHLSSSIKGVTVGDSSVADVNVLDPSHLHILGKRLGSTNVILLCEKGPCDTIEVEVTHDLNGLKSKLHELLPEEHPKVLSSQGSIVLSGQVSSVQKMDAILKIANTFVLAGEQQPSQMRANTSQVSNNIGEAGGSSTAPSQPGSAPGAPKGQQTGVINLMQIGGPQQVMLSVTVAEINRTLARNLKVDFSAIGAGGDFSSGAISGTGSIDALSKTVGVASSIINPYGMFFKFIGRDVSVNTVINASRTNGLAKILAEPNLTVISGQDADFLSGGEFPVPVPQNTGIGGSITIQFKPYGVMLKFLPVVLDSGRINLRLNIDVSEISPDNAVTIPVGNSSTSYTIPSVLKRSANSSLELDDGQSLGIAGLISDKMHEKISKFPGLGDIPLLGQLFTSQTYLNDETELMIFITPHLVKPIAPDKILLPTDKFVAASDREYYLMGRTEALHDKPRGLSTQNYTGGLRGHFGQQP